MAEGRKEQHDKETEEEVKRENRENGVEYDEDDIDEAIEETFPASDPIAPQDPGGRAGKRPKDS